MYCTVLDPDVNAECVVVNRVVASVVELNFRSRVFLSGVEPQQARQSLGDLRRHRLQLRVQEGPFPGAPRTISAI